MYMNTVTNRLNRDISLKTKKTLVFALHNIKCTLLSDFVLFDLVYNIKCTLLNDFVVFDLFYNIKCTLLNDFVIFYLVHNIKCIELTELNRELSELKHEDKT